MRRIRGIDRSKAFIPRSSARSFNLKLAGLVDQKSLSAISGMCYTALAAYYYFFVQYLRPEVIGVTIVTTVLAFVMALLYRIEVLKLRLSVRERLNVVFLTGVIFMLSIVIFASSIATYGIAAVHAILAFVLSAFSTHFLLSSRVGVDDRYTPVRS